tara:strand:- start:530 stop:772 length:243 start_codon:yes stop_codon:yes gene_type:complete
VNPTPKGIKNIMTIYEIKRLTKETAPYFFSKDTMRFFGQTLKDFKVKKQIDGRYKITAKGKYNTTTKRFFNPKNNELENK